MGGERGLVGMNSATNLARKITREIIHHGITDIVLSPGSRNAPLSIALFQAEQRGLVKLHVRIDERTAAFFALGVAKASRRAVALLCTSGTAAANYHPAVLEAHHSRVSLLVITADRPARLRNTGANQTTLQANLYGPAVNFSLDLAAVDTELSELFSHLKDGPVHVNVQFDEPLLPDEDSDWLAGCAALTSSLEVAKPSAVCEISEPRGVLVIGHDHAGIDLPEVREFASQLGWPVVAEDPLSFANATAHSALFLASEKIRQLLKPNLVIVIGRTTLSRSTNAYVKLALREIVIDPNIKNVDRSRQAAEIFTELPVLKKSFIVDAQWHEHWQELSRSTATAFSVIPDWSEPNIARSVASAIPDGMSVYVASSRPVRDLEAFAQPRSGLEVFANRGLAGIDGNISTALGIASQRKSSIAILGDLSFLHDITGLIGTSEINLRILVINNDGGGIFSTLPQATVEGFERIFGTPHGKDPAALSSAMGIPAVRVKNMDDLLERLLLPIRGLSVVVADVPDREKNAQTIKTVYSLIERISLDSTH